MLTSSLLLGTMNECQCHVVHFPYIMKITSLLLCYSISIQMKRNGRGTARGAVWINMIGSPISQHISCIYIQVIVQQSVLCYFAFVGLISHINKPHACYNVLVATSIGINWCTTVYVCIYIRVYVEMETTFWSHDI